MLTPVAGIYLATAARHVLGGDNGEFATLYAEGGVAHPSGYPLYTLYLRALSWLPGVSPAHGAALATALLGVAVAAALYTACRAWGASPAGAAFAAVVYATSPRAWGLATEAEVFTLNALVGAVVVALAAPGGPARGTRRTVLLGLAAGAGLANHLTVVLLAPVGLDGAARGARESGNRLRAWALGALALLPGLLTYGYLVAVARHPGDRWVWADVSTAAGLLRHVVRADYGVGRLATHGGPPAPGAQLGALAVHALRDLLVVPTLLGCAAVVGAVARWLRGLHRGRPADDHAARSAAVLAATLALAGPLFAARFNIALTGVGWAIVARFHLLPEVLLSVFVAQGADAAARRVSLGTRARALLVAGAGVIGAAATLPGVLAAHRSVLEDYVFDTLHTAPPGAVVLGTGDHRQLGVLYAQRALGVRRDVLYIDPWLLLLPAPRARVERALGRPLPPLRGRTVDTRALALAVLSTGRPLFLTDVFTPAIVRSFPTYPLGTLIRVLPPGEALPDPGALAAMNDRVFAGYRVRRAEGAVDPWFALAYADYARPWGALAAVFGQRGDTVRAEACAQRAAALTPPAE